MASRTPSRLLNLQRTQQTIRLQATKSRPRSQCIRPGSDSTPAASRYWYTVQYDVRRKYSTESSSAQSDAGSSFADAANAVVHGSRRTESETSSYYEQAYPTPRSRYRELVQNGSLRPDKYQEQIIDKLQGLHDKLVNYEQMPISEPRQTSLSLISRLFSRSTASTSSENQSSDDSSDVPHGLYLYGDVGTGKSMLMDLFYDTIPPRHAHRRRRVHFHAFMVDVHKRVHRTKIALGLEGGDPIEPVARELAKEATIVCFDEFQVTDIVDAMILRRLLETMRNYGVVFVMTSNRHPDELYKNGIQRSSFIPCIELLKSKFEVINLDSGTDYRRIPRALSHVYFDPLTDENREEINKLFVALAGGPSKISYDRHLKIWGRTLHIPESGPGEEGQGAVAKFTFDELCGHPLSAADYIEVTRTFRTVFVTDVPKMDLGQKDKARRFITFIDACYESKTKLFISSEVPIFQVFSDNSGGNKSVSDHQRSVMDDLGISDSTVGTSSMFTGEEEIFAFARCCSRLVQMGSKEWAETSGREY